MAVGAGLPFFFHALLAARAGGLLLDFLRRERGGDFSMTPTQVTGSTIAKLNDTCGNVLQLVQLMKW